MSRIRVAETVRFVSEAGSDWWMGLRRCEGRDEAGGAKTCNTEMD